jgi:hypothetical protein
MSGGYFDYQQYQIAQIADDIEMVIENNDCQRLNEYGDRVGRGYSFATIARFREAVQALRLAQVYAQRIDWLLSDDDGEDSFSRRLESDLRGLGE